nr:hypothetical protein [Tanacetum cinerariifolium]
MCFNSSTKLYNCQLDEQWFNLHKDILRDALDITPTNDNNPYVAPLSSLLDKMIGKYLVEEGGATESPKATKVTKPKAAKATKPAGDKAPKLTSTQRSKPKPAPTQPSKAVLEKKQNLVKDTPDEPSLAKISKGRLVGKIRKPKSPLKLVDEPSNEDVPGPARPVVIREPDPGRIQPLPDVQGKGKEKVIDEQAAHDLFTLLNPKNKSLVDQFIFRRRTPMPTEASGHVESPSLDVKLALIDSEMESDNIVSKINTGDQDEGLARPNPGNHDEGQVGPNPGVQDEGQAGSNPGDAAES